MNYINTEIQTLFWLQVTSIRKYLKSASYFFHSVSTEVQEAFNQIAVNKTVGRFCLTLCVEWSPANTCCQGTVLRWWTATYLILLTSKLTSDTRKDTMHGQSCPHCEWPWPSSSEHRGGSCRTLEVSEQQDLHNTQHSKCNPMHMLTTRTNAVLCSSTLRPCCAYRTNQLHHWLFQTEYCLELGWLIPQDVA